MSYIEGETGEIYYRKWDVANPQAVIVFLHGFGEHSGLYDRYAASLATRNIALWALDHPGHGRSEGRRGYIESLSVLGANGRKLMTLVQEQLPAIPIILQGHSLGAATALYLAITDTVGVEKLVLSGAPLAQPDWMAEPTEEANGTIELAAADLSRDETYLRALDEDPLCFTEGDEGESLVRALEQLWQILPDRIGEVQLPVLLVHGEDDAVASFDFAVAESAALPDRTVVSFAGGKHDIINDIVHAEVATAVADFVLREGPK